MEKEMKLVSISEIELQEVEWLWYPYIPFGKITIIQGDPGEGKTILKSKNGLYEKYSPQHGGFCYKSGIHAQKLDIWLNRSIITDYFYKFIDFIRNTIHLCSVIHF